MSVPHVHGTVMLQIDNGDLLSGPCNAGARPALPGCSGDQAAPIFMRVV